MRELGLERHGYRVSVVTPDYFVLLALSPDGNVGRARYELRVAGPKLAAQL